jgi:hypothetical protein
MSERASEEKMYNKYPVRPVRSSPFAKLIVHILVIAVGLEPSDRWP